MNFVFVNVLLRDSGKGGESEPKSPSHARPRWQAPRAGRGPRGSPVSAALASALPSDAQWPRTPREAPGHTGLPVRSIPARAACPPARLWPGRGTRFGGSPWAVLDGTKMGLFEKALPARVCLPCPFVRGMASSSVARGSPFPRPCFPGFSWFGPLCLQAQRPHSWGTPAGPVASFGGGALRTLEPPGWREGA